MKIFSEVQVRQDVCWDTNPQKWMVHPQLLDLRLLDEPYV